MPIPFKPCKLQGLFGGHGLVDPWAYWGYLSLWVLAVPPCNLVQRMRIAFVVYKIIVGSRSRICRWLGFLH